MKRLLTRDDPSPVAIHRAQGGSPFVLVCDHGGNLVPRRLGTLGLAQSELDRHIGWDIGIFETSRRLSDRLDAPLIAQLYSRLVIDCNRAPSVDSAMPAVSDGTAVPANQAIAPDEALMREAEIFRPYHDAVARMLDDRLKAQRPAILIAMHSFTPHLSGRARPWHIGVLFNRDARLGRELAALLRQEEGLCVGVNEPYVVDMQNDYTIPVHGEGRGIPHVEIEIRQDQLADAAGWDRWAERLARLLPQAAQRMAGAGIPGHNAAGLGTAGRAGQQGVK